jgi:hypothetical protein
VAKEWTLARELAGWDDDALTRLFGLRPDLPVGAISSWQQLADRATTERSLLYAVSTLDRGAHQLLGAILTFGPTVPRKSVEVALEAGDGRIERPLRELVARALAFEQGDDLRGAPGFGRINLTGLGRPAKVLLNGATVPMLQTALQALGLMVPGKDKRALVEALVTALSDTERLQAVIESGPPGTMELVERLALGPATAMLPYSLSSSDSTEIGYLLRRGILVQTGWNTAELPMDIALQARGGLFVSFDADPPDVAPLPVDAALIDSDGVHDALRLVADVTALVEEWSRQPAKQLKTGGVAVREVRRLEKLLERTEHDTARIIELAGFAGLVGPSRSGDEFAPTGKADEWVTTSVGERWAELAYTWLHARAHLSEAGAKDERDKIIPPLSRWQPDDRSPAQRRALLAGYELVAPGEGADVMSVMERATWSSRSAWMVPGRDVVQLTGWIVEEAELLGIMSRPALTSIGRALVGGRILSAAAIVAEAAPKPTETMVIQADLTAVVSGEMSPEFRREMDLLADQESSGAASVYRFTESSLRGAFDAGRKADEILTFLETRAPKGVPQTLSYLVTDVARRHGGLRVSNANSYIRSDDAALLAEVSRHKKLSALKLRLLAPTVAISPLRSEQVVEKLRAAGYLPMAEDAEGVMLTEQPSRHRSGAGAPPQARWMVQEQDDDQPQEHVAKVIAALRGAPAPSVPKPVQPHQPPNVSRNLGSLFDGIDDDEERPRPTVIARDADAILEVLVDAYEWEWIVRLSYAARDGRERQITAVPLGIIDRTVHVADIESDKDQRIRLDKIQWVRVLTEAEEEQFL